MILKVPYRWSLGASFSVQSKPVEEHFYYTVFYSYIHNVIAQKYSDYSKGFRRRAILHPKCLNETIQGSLLSEWCICRFEYGHYITGGMKQGLNRRPTIHATTGEKFSVQSAQNYFDLVLTSLDCWVWVLGQGFYHPKNMVGKLV